MCCAAGGGDDDDDDATGGGWEGEGGEDGEGGEGGEGGGGGEAVLLPRAVAPYGDAALDTAEVGLEWAESVDSSDPRFVV